MANLGRPATPCSSEYGSALSDDSRARLIRPAPRSLSESLHKPLRPSPSGSLSPFPCSSPNTGFQPEAVCIPTPPLCVTISFRSSDDNEGQSRLGRGLGVGPEHMQRYYRKGSNQDAGAAKVGNGAFGTVYKYERDQAFTPPYSEPGDAAPNTQQPGRSSVRAPSVVAVKVCRTPTGGSFDEFCPDSRKIQAASPGGSHTRIVRGEARILRYLQNVSAFQNDQEGSRYIVRLLADEPAFEERVPPCAVAMLAPPDGVTRPGTRHSSSARPSTPSSLPPHRMLVFERLFELDAELTPSGWRSGRTYWTMEKVERVARQVAEGVKWLHFNHVTHGDLKPSNIMQDPRTGDVKIIDLGASRRFVRLPNSEGEDMNAVETMDRALCPGTLAPSTFTDVFDEGLACLTGSPHFMAPEVLLQATRYTDANGKKHNILEDYEADPTQLSKGVSTAQLSFLLAEYRRGWGVKADIWSWGICILSMLRRTTLAKPGERRGSASVCPFDFSFDSHGDALEPLHPLHHGEGALPSFHRWARRFPVRIDNKILQGISLPEEAADLSQTMKAALRAALTHRDQRPSSARLCEMLDGLETECEEKSPLEGTFVWANGTPDLERQTSVARSQSLARRPSGSVARGVPDSPLCDPNRGTFGHEYELDQQVRGIAPELLEQAELEDATEYLSTVSTSCAATRYGRNSRTSLRRQGSSSSTLASSSPSEVSSYVTAPPPEVPFIDQYVVSLGPRRRPPPAACISPFGGKLDRGVDSFGDVVWKDDEAQIFEKDRRRMQGLLPGVESAWANSAPTTPAPRWMEQQDNVPRPSSACGSRESGPARKKMSRPYQAGMGLTVSALRGLLPRKKRNFSPCGCTSDESQNGQVSVTDLDLHALQMEARSDVRMAERVCNGRERLMSRLSDQSEQRNTYLSPANDPPGLERSRTLPTAREHCAPVDEGCEENQGRNTRSQFISAPRNAMRTIDESTRPDLSRATTAFQPSTTSRSTFFGQPMRVPFWRSPEPSFVEVSAATDIADPSSSPIMCVQRPDDLARDVPSVGPVRPSREMWSSITPLRRRSTKASDVRTRPRSPEDEATTELPFSVQSNNLQSGWKSARWASSVKKQVKRMRERTA